MDDLRKALCVEIEEQQMKLLALIDTLDPEATMSLKELVLELERIRQHAADLQTANDLRAGLIARQRSTQAPAEPERGSSEPQEHAHHA